MYISQIFLLDERSDVAKALYKRAAPGRGREGEAERIMGVRDSIN